MLLDPILLNAWQTGLLTSAGLIIAIGSQNAFVLSYALRRQHAIGIASVCAAIDTLLITVGVLGMGLLMQSHPFFLKGALWFGICFLVGYGALALWRALSPHTLKVQERPPITFNAAILATLAISLLNPHVYLDTVMLIGSVGGQFQGLAQTSFIVGAAMASIIWFFSLAWGAQFLAPLFASSWSWRVLDLSVCVFMWWVAAGLWGHELL
ncbi:LysE/ArgO family amino acid transporter [Dasania marina]|uniref:LysE/ArgO family amino acid transporter n=1 Tax=Dasania marina TaxID=471499 RepID=UPI00035E6C41|nr:LysE family transporter [Dasania marina]